MGWEYPSEQGVDSYIDFFRVVTGPMFVQGVQGANLTKEKKERKKDSEHTVTQIKEVAWHFFLFTMLRVRI